ncbi:acyl carrier protein [Embleya hyalina]|uniref:Polyketide synthase PksL n=1 Tax=Embleya hyalina TaxID=516124 RepID=A0A401Z6D9_9ACTN|nr:acyl carrier protein [Embleya hyalina]GCE02432.1 polyketide synthase PksL [Embleya hyalina]
MPVNAALLDEIVDQTARLISLDVTRIDPDDTFAELGVDAILAVEFADVLGKRYGISVAPAAILARVTPSGLAEFVDQVRAGGTA